MMEPHRPGAQDHESRSHRRTMSEGSSNLHLISPTSNSRQAGSDGQKKKRSRRRAPKACDECRLRKTKCDSLQPCEACFIAERSCTYGYRTGQRESLTQRIRILQDRLRRARAYFQELQRREPKLGDIDFDHLLTTSMIAQEGKEISQVEDSESDEELPQPKIDGMMSSYGRLDDNTTWATRYYGAASGYAFLYQTRDYFPRPGGNTSRVDTTDPAITHLFDAPLQEPGATGTSPHSAHLIPRRETTDELLDSIFTIAYPLMQFLYEPHFRAMVARIYNLDPLQFEQADRDFLPLFYLILAMGHLFNESQHERHGCQEAVTQAINYYQVARGMVDVTRCDNLQSLQILLSFILVLISTGRLASAHAFIGLACSATLRLGLHHRSNHDSSLSTQERDVRRKVFWSVIKLDMSASVILGLPAFINLKEVDLALELTLDKTFTVAETAYGISTDNITYVKASAKHLEILRIVSKAIKTLFPNPAITKPNNRESQNISVSIKKFEKIEMEFKAWERSTSDLFPEQGAQDLIHIKYELEMAYYFGQLVLHRPFLHYLSKMVTTTAVDSKHSQRALTCLKIASSTISRSQVMLQRGVLRPASWTSIYAIFMSVVCLMFLIASHPGTRHPEKACQQAECGIRLLAHAACYDLGSTKCLEVLKALVKHLSHTVYFDIDEIRASTPKVCSASSHTHPAESWHQNRHPTEMVSSSFLSLDSSFQEQLFSPASAETDSQATTLSDTHKADCRSVPPPLPSMAQVSHQSDEEKTLFRNFDDSVPQNYVPEHNVMWEDFMAFTHFGPRMPSLNHID